MPKILTGRLYVPPVLPTRGLLKSVLAPSLPPAAYDVDANLPRGNVPPMMMDGNSDVGDCVLAAQGKFLRRALAAEYGTLIAVQEQEIVTAYFLETGGADTGLNIEDSLANWMQAGWVGGGQLRKCAAYARVDATNATEVKQAVSRLGGAIIGINLPQGWVDANDAGQVWDVPPADATIVGGHAMYVVAYDADGVTVETWGQRQVLTWPAFAWCAADANQGECVAVVRQDDAGVTPLDGDSLAVLQGELKEIQEAS